MSRLFFVQLIFLYSVEETVAVKSLCVQNYHLNVELKLNTQGNAGMEYFTIGDKHYLASANFWDGQSSDMSAISEIFEINVGAVNSKSVSISANKQKISTKGCHGADYFMTKDGQKFLVFPNYYGCGSRKEDIGHYPNCYSTIIYRHDNKSDSFKIFQKLEAEGPAQTDHFNFQNSHYIVIAENFNDQLSIYKLISKFKKVQTLSCTGVGAMAVETLPDQSIVLIGASYHNNGWKTKSLVYHMPIGHKLFKFVHSIQSFGAHDAEMIYYRDSLFLFLSEDRNEKTSHIFSNVYRLEYSMNVGLEKNMSVVDVASVKVSGDVGFPSETVLKSNETASTSHSSIEITDLKFIHVQSLPTDGAHAAEFFINNDTLYLAIANFGDRQAKRINSLSTLWEYNVSKNSSKFEVICNVPTQGATDWEYFQINNQSYLAVSNEGDPGDRNQKSIVYSFSQHND